MTARARLHAFFRKRRFVQGIPGKAPIVKPSRHIPALRLLRRVNMEILLSA
ncbi:hypothetical protein P262_03365 [Cronobacter malonaticus]|uniref:Uncharacterized protein n=1 Tax=Cronobacter malonaticus TaxID=413503 RepID=V5U194_9ENTR|nr:hypothetical protein P262_03365 [Cronobacter malonaticus]